MPWQWVSACIHKSLFRKLDITVWIEIHQISNVTYEVLSLTTLWRYLPKSADMHTRDRPSTKMRQTIKRCLAFCLTIVRPNMFWLLLSLLIFWSNNILWPNTVSFAKYALYWQPFPLGIFHGQPILADCADFAHCADLDVFILNKKIYSISDMLVLYTSGGLPKVNLKYQLMCAAKILKYIQQLSTTDSYGCIPGGCRQFYNQNRLFWQKKHVRPTDIVSAN